MPWECPECGYFLRRLRNGLYYCRKCKSTDLIFNDDKTEYQCRTCYGGFDNV